MDRINTLRQLIKTLIDFEVFNINKQETSLKDEEEDKDFRV